MLDVDLMRAADVLVRPDCELQEVSWTKSICDALIMTNVVANKEDAKEMVQRLVRAGALTETVSSVMYEVVGRRKGAAMNDWFDSVVFKRRSATEFADEFNAAVVPVMATVLYNKGKNVHYHKIRSVPEWWKILVLLAELKDIEDIGTLEDSAKKAFFFNLCNIMIFHSRTLRAAPEGIRGRAAYFQGIRYNVGGLSLNYTEMEHGILRRKFVDREKATRERCMELMVKEIDPRMHFALNCGAQSCPAIRPYTASGLNSELEVATAEYLQENTIIQAGMNQIKLPRLLKWFRGDFAEGQSDMELVNFAMRYISPKQQVETHTCNKEAPKLIVQFAKYDWADNSKPDSKPEISLMVAYDYSFYLNR